MPFKTLVDEIEQIDLTRTITSKYKRLYEVSQNASTQQLDINQISEISNNVEKRDRNNIEEFENAVCNVLNGINITYDRKNFKGRPTIAFFAPTVAHTEIDLHTTVDVLNDHKEKLNKNQERNLFKDI